ncbi:hypothetical protein ACFLT9_01430 [Acidobacteriota bacterium]
MKAVRFITGLICFFFLLTAINCTSPQSKTYVVVTFDVEDYTTPASEGLDEIPKWLAEIMSEEGVTGTFFVIGEKARSLENRGRQDVIGAMAQHDIGSHTNFGSIHPTVTEQLEKEGWGNGVVLMQEQESAGVQELTRIFGVPVTSLARHGGSYGPQLIAALGQMHAGYVGSPVTLPGRNVVWFCNALNFSGQYDSFDNAYYRDDLFDPLMEKIEVEFPRIIQSVDAISLFAGHPCKIRTEQFWDFNFYYGANPKPEDWKSPELRPLESMETAQKNFRRLMRFLKEQDGIEITTFRDLMRIYSFQRGSISRKELASLADKTVKKGSIPFSDFFSPAEIFYALAESIDDYRNIGTLPNDVKLKRPFGPMEMPESSTKIDKVTIEEVHRLAGEAKNYIDKFDSLPAHLEVRTFPIGTGSLLALFSTVYLDLNTKTHSTEYKVSSFESYPESICETIIQGIKGYKSWPVHRRDLNMDNIIELTKTQLWTLKPAHRGPDTR